MLLPRCYHYWSWNVCVCTTFWCSDIDDGTQRSERSFPQLWTAHFFFTSCSSSKFMRTADSFMSWFFFTHLLRIFIQINSRIPLQSEVKLRYFRCRTSSKYFWHFYHKSSNVWMKKFIHTHDHDHDTLSYYIQFRQIKIRHLQWDARHRFRTHKL